METTPIEKFFELVPKSEKTIVRHKFVFGGWTFLNDLGEPCLYRIVATNDHSVCLGAIKYYRGRKLSCYEMQKVNANA